MNSQDLYQLACRVSKSLSGWQHLIELIQRSTNGPGYRHMTREELEEYIPVHRLNIQAEKLGIPKIPDGDRLIKIEDLLGIVFESIPRLHKYFYND